MVRLVRIDRLLKAVAAPLILAVLAGYFVHFTVNGDRSLNALRGMERTVLTQAEMLDQLRAERGELESDVIALRPDSIDPDMLEERARIVLGYTREDEVIILAPDENYGD